jgi:cell filamentation protein
MNDVCCYPGTRVLRNKENIRDQDELRQFEREAARNRAETLPPDMPITADGYRGIHRHIFQDVYDWAGKGRTVDISGHGTFFLSVDLIASELENRFAKINAENNLQHLGRVRFAARAAEHTCELNTIHPFREGNGRTLRAFLDILARQAGHRLDPTLIDREAWNSASREANYMQDSTAMRNVIANALVEGGV